MFQDSCPSSEAATPPSDGAVSVLPGAAEGCLRNTQPRSGLTLAPTPIGSSCWPVVRSPVESGGNVVPFSRGDLLVASYPSGGGREFFRECARKPPDAIVFLAGKLFVRPVERELDQLRAAGIRVRWVLGTHDENHDPWYRREFAWDEPGSNLHGRSEQIGGLRVVGLGGQFRREVWWPRHDATVPAAITREACWERLRVGTGWRYGLPTDLRHALFPEEVEDCAKLQADVLLAAEPPNCHPDGFAAIDRAASLCGARLVVHGHFSDAHEQWTLPGGTQVRGVGIGRMLRLRCEDLP